MSASSTTLKPAGACDACARRCWLLSELSAPLSYCARDRERLMALLELEDAELLQALGGRRRAELRAGYERFDAGMLRRGAEVEAICCHRPGFPSALDGPGAPRLLNVLGSAQRLSALCSAPVVAIVGSRLASDYGREQARSLARGLAASGVSVLGGWEQGIAFAAHTGALEAGGAGLAVIGGGLGVAAPARSRTLLAQLTRGGCAVSELTCECDGRHWAGLAGERIIAALAAVTVVVEARASSAELAPARLAQAYGRVLAAVPGRVSSPLSAGTNLLLRGGATLVREPGDVLELLCELDAAPSTSRCALQPEPLHQAQLQPRLRRLLERVGAGSDTPDGLMRSGLDAAEVLMGLSELELLGLLRRGDGGRYVPTQALGSRDGSLNM